MNRDRNNNTGNKSLTLIKFIVFLVILGILAPIVLFFKYNLEITKPQSTDESVLFFKIDQGDSREVIAERLAELNVIENGEWFIWYSKISKKGGDIKAGNHILKKNMSIIQIMKELESIPDESTVWVTIPEGLRYDEIVEIISKSFVNAEEKKFDRELFLAMCKEPHNYKNLNLEGLNFAISNIPEGKSIEGFLYPDTYNFKVDATTNDVINLLTKTLRTKLDDKYGEAIKSAYIEYGSLYKIINIASMLEREARNEEEGKMIADIINRRLDKGYFLGIDATSLYYLKDWKAELTYKQLDDPNPYNTRKNLGLPPTPISNPGIGTIDAVINPKENEYLYYLHDEEGKIHYSKDLDGHNTNYNQYLK